jgi:alpha-1,3-glucosyltransferase
MATPFTTPALPPHLIFGCFLSTVSHATTTEINDLWTYQWMRTVVLAALLNSSMSIFLFSFEVHEKTTLLPLFPLTLLLSTAPHDIRRRSS